MVKRILNFSAGPAVLPLEVLEEARDNLLSLGGSGLGIMEISHRTRDFEAILAEAEGNLRELLGLSAAYKVLFLSGGASTQFFQVPMNLLGPGQVADYVLTGVWSQKAVAEAQLLGQVHVAASTESERFRRIPHNEELRLSAAPAYVHTTSNNTIYGTQWQWEPDCAGHPLVCDMSSDFLSRPVAVERYGLIYAGAQKNAGPAGVTVVIVNQELLARSRAEVKRLPTLLRYQTQIDNQSMYNTPPTFPIYVVHLVLRWLKKHGGLAAMALHNQRKAAPIYQAIDAHPGFYQGHASPESRSLMNITFRLPNEALEALFVKESLAAGMDGLKGHRSVGGLRASVYNAFPQEGAQVLADFMHAFVRRHG